MAPVTNMRLDIEHQLANQVGALPLPFPGMDKSGSAVCEFYVGSTCAKAISCPFRHVRGDKTVVCKHWLRGLCKKGDGCEFLHEYDMSKMPECYFYSRFSKYMKLTFTELTRLTKTLPDACHNKECPFLHIDPESKIKDCPWYDRGFCRHGPMCRHRHVRRVLCLNYLAGFCPDGPNCQDAHPRFEIPAPPEQDPRLAKKVVITCHYCGEVGHKVSHCTKMPPDLKEQHLANSQFFGVGEVKVYNGYNQGGHFVRRAPYGRPNMPASAAAAAAVAAAAASNSSQSRPEGGKMRNLEDVVCYKCGEKGHFANRCNKGHLAFLSLQHNQHNLKNHQH